MISPAPLSSASDGPSHSVASSGWRPAGGLYPEARPLPLPDTESVNRDDNCLRTVNDERFV